MGGEVLELVKELPKNTVGIEMRGVSLSLFGLTHMPDSGYPFAGFGCDPLQQGDGCDPKRSMAFLQSKFQCPCMLGARGK